MKRKRRGLTADDKAVWRAVTETVLPRDPQGQRSPLAPARSETTPIAPRAETSLGRGTFPAAWRDAASSPSVPTGTVRFIPGEPRPGPVGRPQAGLDRRTADRLRKGSREPDARLDLHGMTADRAHRALDRFMGEAHRRGHRCVLVITGKGGRREVDDVPWLEPGIGVLRDAVPRWLRSGPHGRAIVGIFEAHQRHGGAGALYVYLKRRQENSRR